MNNSFQNNVLDKKIVISFYLSSLLKLFLNDIIKYVLFI